MPGSHLITCDATTLRQVILLLVHALTCGIPLVVEMLLKARSHRRIQASNVVDLDGVEASDGCGPISMDNLMVPQKDVAG